MLSEEQIKKLKSENDLLQIQLQDVNYMISIREEELEILRSKAKHAVMLKSQLEGTFHELAQMQNTIGQKQREAEGAARREAALEDEMIQSINIEKNFYSIRDKFQSATAALNDLNNELSEAAKVHKELANAKSKISEQQSLLEIADEEKEFLRYEINKLKKSSMGYGPTT